MLGLRGETQLFWVDMDRAGSLSGGASHPERQVLDYIKTNIHITSSRVARGAYGRPCRIRALAGLPGRVTPMYLRTAFVHPAAPHVLHGCRKSWLRGSDSSRGTRTSENGPGR